MVQLMPGDIVLIKLDVFQGKRKVKDLWNKADYVVVCHHLVHLSRTHSTEVGK